LTVMMSLLEEDEPSFESIIRHHSKITSTKFPTKCTANIIAALWASPGNLCTTTYGRKKSISQFKVVSCIRFEVSNSIFNSSCPSLHPPKATFVYLWKFWHTALLVPMMSFCNLAGCKGRFLYSVTPPTK
jgi:hypothetical protein